ncbi:MAG: aspartate carbamoyltransferase regulatory subunit [Acidilobus sp.]
MSQGTGGEGRKLLVSKIRDGTVIDHIPAGRALVVLRILGVTGSEGFRVAVVMNVDSARMKVKDIVKLEGYYPRMEDIMKVSLVAPEATVNTVRDYNVVEKRRVEVPKVIEGVLRCPNPTCISRKSGEPVVSRFEVISSSPLRLRCYYCGTELGEREVISQLVGGS